MISSPIIFAVSEALTFGSRNKFLRAASVVGDTGGVSLSSGHLRVINSSNVLARGGSLKLGMANLVQWS